MKISWQIFWLLLWCWQRKLNVQQARDVSGVSLLTIRRWYEKFRVNLPALEEFILQGQVCMDEAFFFGKEKGTALIAAKQLESEKRKVAYKIIYRTALNKQDAMNFIFQCVKPNSTLRTDGGGIYRGIEKWWPLKHLRDIHKKFEFELTSEIEGLFGNLRTFIRRMYHHVTREKFEQIVGEFFFRFCHLEYFENPLNYLKNSLSLVPLC
jgi:hypothetical protein